jgi:hypothetical protein
VAIFNQKYFILFLFYTALLCIYSGTLLVMRFVSCTRNLRQCTVGGVSAALCVINFVEAIVFGLFVIVMMFDQFGAIMDPMPAHGPYSGPPAHVKGKYEAVCDVFGERLSVRWLLPLRMPQKVYDDFQKECAMGEVREPSFSSSSSRDVEKAAASMQQHFNNHGSSNGPVGPNKAKKATATTMSAATATAPGSRAKAS